MGHQTRSSTNHAIRFQITMSLIAAAVMVVRLSAQDSKPLSTPASPGQAIQDAARASAHEPPQEPPKSVEILYGGLAKSGAIEILSDTKGIDFGPYLRNIVADVRGNWYKRIPADAQTKKGKLAIQFAILPDGRIAALTLVETSGDVSLDRPALEAITASNPLPALPSAFNGPNLALRLRFYYNPSKGDLAGTSGSVTDPTEHAVVVQSVADSHPPKYPKKARKEKIEGIVRLDVHVAADGKVQSVLPVEGSLLLSEAASNTIQKWTFRPAQRDGKPVEDRVRINVEFHSDGVVRVQIVRHEGPLPEKAAP